MTFKKNLTLLILIILFLVLNNSQSSYSETKSINPLSVVSLYLNIYSDSKLIGNATGFVVKKNNINYLITNWHVVTGINPYTQKSIFKKNEKPTKLEIISHGNVLGKWLSIYEQLYDGKGKRKWIEHKLGSEVDVVALPLNNVDKKTIIYDLDLSLANTDMIPEVAMPISIIGFPLGLTVPGNFPIWKTGHIATDPDLDYYNKPIILIDATTRGGMSGAPVVLRLMGGYKKRDGSVMMAGSKIQTRLLGIYSGRLPRDSEIGIVWKPIVIQQILEN